MQLEENSNLVKFISRKNIIVSSDDFTHLISGWKTANMDYSLYIHMKKKKQQQKTNYINLNSQAKVRGFKNKVLETSGNQC